MMPTFGQHSFKGSDNDGVLALVVRRAAAIPPLPLNGDIPRVQPVAPLLGDATHNVAVAIGKEGRQAWILDPFGHQKRPATGYAVGRDLAYIAQRGHRRRNFVLKISAKIRQPIWFLALGWDGHAAAQSFQKSATVKGVAHP